MSYETFLLNVKKYHIYEISASEKICLLNNIALKKFNDDYQFFFGYYSLKKDYQYFSSKQFFSGEFFGVQHFIV